MLNERPFAGAGRRPLAPRLTAETATLGAPPLDVPPLTLAVTVFLCILAASTYAGVVDFSPGLLRYVGELWGRKAPSRLLSWQQFVRTTQSQSGNARSIDSQQQAGSALSQSGNASRKLEQSLLEPTNSFWNRLPYLADQDHWGMPDYWATPVETQGSNGGDCEDYAIGKYFTFRELGIPASKLRISYVKVSGRDETHVVLAYYADVDADPLILDSLTDEILPGSQRTDLKPVYSFNDDDLWMASNNVKIHHSGQVRLWQEVLEKMAKEQRM